MIEQKDTKAGGEEYKGMNTRKREPGHGCTATKFNREMVKNSKANE
jgi:hypothetical protein